MNISEEDLQHALMLTSKVTARKISKQLNLPETFADYCIDDRGNVVDFHDRSGLVAKLDREATVDGKSDQLAFIDKHGGDALEKWIRENGYGEELDEASVPD